MFLPKAALPCHDPIWSCPSTKGETDALIRVGYLSDKISKSLKPSVIQPPTTITFSPWNTLSSQLKFYSKWFSKQTVDRFTKENHCQVKDQHWTGEGCWNIFYFDNLKPLSKKTCWDIMCDWVCDNSTPQHRQSILQQYGGKSVQLTNFMSLLHLHNVEIDCMYFVHWQVDIDKTSDNYLHSQHSLNILDNPDLILRVSLFENNQSDYRKIDANFFIMNHKERSTIFKSKLGTVCEWIAKIIPICILRYNETKSRKLQVGPTTSAVMFVTLCDTC